ncbi:CpsB/CapC family capsule biosynthesis tyrosine phosphatase [Bacillus sp. B15-48]|uniref:tyrosine-protein phosphatase n=1 Tax=Bacillus sp. B15-48 TaxID=1548601 RepID=UPI00193FCDC2|nr:CpsB/CapC family capsule biosynthesis tyrosine phosphatase [Bacillus sp. B15-48]MBM4761469.1 tyrosine protein phosphatase [Bacillus sp. B15-48]
MIDIHCHILAGIDDGAQKLEDSLAMAREAVAEGITTIIATPHHKNGRYENPREIIVAKVAELNKSLQVANIPLTVLVGQEPAINGELLADYENNKLVPLNETQYVFVEFPSSHVPRYAEKMLFDLQLKGLVPVIVHPERNAEIVERPERLLTLVDKGALAQLTAGSVCGKFGKKIKRFSEQLIEANLVHFLASDAHNVTSRSFHMGQAYDQIEKQLGIDVVYLLRENAELLVEGATVYKEVPQPVKRKKFLGIF